MPYWFYKQVNKNEFGYSLEITSSIVNVYGANSKIIGQLDQAFYSLHGIYKRYGITSGKKNSIGTPDEFVNGTRFEASCLDQSILICFACVEDRRVYHKVEQIIRFYTKQLRGEVSTDLLVAINVSILSQLGADLPKNWKRPSYKYIKILFLGDLLEDGTVNRVDLYNLALAESFMIQYGPKYDKITRARSKLKRRLNGDQRKKLDCGPVQNFVYEYNTIWQRLADITQEESI